ncbi:MAG: hypothetical protein CM15mP47_4560 [Methanobacteriota archaeon]|nr:MAG: hypothetical protein CM15mP47_4560 [Euryarchaeota archaeon]
MAEGTIAESFVLEDESRGMIGPFCLETIVTDKLSSKFSKLVRESLRVQTHLLVVHLTPISMKKECLPAEGLQDPSRKREMKIGSQISYLSQSSESSSPAD